METSRAASGWTRSYLSTLVRLLSERFCHRRDERSSRFGLSMTQFGHWRPVLIAAQHSGTISSFAATAMVADGWQD
jgi:hypothetical protein